MSNQLLFDYTAIDLNRPQFTPEDVARVNPQAGDMRMLDNVIWLDEARERGVGVKHVRDDEFWVPVHIPGRPLMPGVLMIEAGAQMCSFLYRHKVEEPRFVGFTRCNDVVFRTQVVPGDTLLLLVKEEKFHPRRFVCRAQGVVNGDIAFEAQITGMVLDSR